MRCANPDLIVAIGSGTVNDLCKWISFERRIPYIVLATAASMNGYSAANVAPMVDGVKTLIEARPPVAVIAEPSVIENAPPEMATAGFADTIAKFFSGADWLVNNTLLDEYYCRFCATLVERFEHLFLDRPGDIAKGESKAIAGLFEALFWAGVSMTLVGTSAPASGGEHLLSHTIDMADVVRGWGWGHDLHGRQVGVGSIFSAALYERLLSIDEPKIVEPPSELDMAWWGGGSIAEAVAEQFKVKRLAYQTAAERIRDAGVWDELRGRIAPIVKSPGQTKKWLEAVGGASRAADIGRTTDELRAAALHMHEIRKRFTVVDLAYLLGIMPGATDEIIEQWLT
jgi:glycerol-1-phosphate dehydrogenase [NAD(P)+]